jgi:hypothetical protein
MTTQPPDPYGQPQQPDPYSPGSPPPPASAPQYPQYQQQGQSQYPPPGQQYPGAPPGYGAPPPGGTTNTMAIISLVLSLAGLLVGITAPVGAVLGHVARKQIRERGEQGDGMALAGIIVGWILTGFMVLGCCGILALALTADSA